MTKPSTQRALTMPQRLAAALATPEVKIRGVFTSAAKRSLKDGTFFVIPTTSVRQPQDRRDSRELGLRELVAQKHPDAASAARPAQIRFSSGEPLPALAVAGLTAKEVRRIAGKLLLDYVWLVKGGHTTLLMTEAGLSIPNGATEVEQADLREAALPVVIRESVGDVDWLPAIPRWTTALRSGWVKGGRLQLSCELCSAELEWADWWNADAVRMKNNAFVYCPQHGGPITKHRGASLRPLVHARQQLDGAVWAQKPSAPVLVVYTFELHGLGLDALYVGQTALGAECRYAQHEALGKNAARILVTGKAQIGPLRQERRPELPALRSREAALAAEHWASLWFKHQGIDVRGDGAS